MREIKFRGIEIDTGVWVYGGFHKHLTHTPPAIGQGEGKFKHIIMQSGFSDWNMPRPLIGLNVYPETVGQYTGVKDKNGVEVYWGDICSGKWPYAKLGVVEWDEKRGMFYIFPMNDMRKASYDKGYKLNASKLEVVGNVIENPDLLPAYNWFIHDNEWFAARGIKSEE